MRSGSLATSTAQRHLHTACCRITHLPKCAACQYGKQSCRPTPGKRTTIIRDREGVLRDGDLLPGQTVSADHFICSTKGRLFKSRGRESEQEMYEGGCLFVDHATGYINVQFQNSLNSHQTLTAKQQFEEHCRDHGVVVQRYQTDNMLPFTGLRLLNLDYGLWLLSTPSTCTITYQMRKRDCQLMTCLPSPGGTTNNSISSTSGAVQLTFWPRRCRTDENCQGGKLDRKGQ
jgi:hypothetical protein